MRLDVIELKEFYSGTELGKTTKELINRVLEAKIDTDSGSLTIGFGFTCPFLENKLKENENKDPKEVVIDEVIGQSVPIYLFEIAHGSEKNFQESILFYIYIFVLFRFFDIKKPFPVNIFDKNYKNSFGVIIDDVIAGLYVVLTLIVFMIIKSRFFVWV